MLTVEITNDESHPSILAAEAVGLSSSGNYDYVVKVKGTVIASGRVENVERQHFSLLLAAVAADARQKEFERAMAM